MSDAKPAGMYLSWNNGSDQLFFDLTVTEQIESNLLVTDHPVENSPDITENARQPPEKFAGTVFVSNAPIVDKNGWRGNITQTNVDVPDSPTAGLVAAVTTAFTGKNSTTVPYASWDETIDAVQYTLQLLQWLQSSKTLLRVITSKKSYNNVMITKVGLNRTAQDGTGGTFSLEFKQLRVVTLAFTASPAPKAKKDTPPVNKGSKGTSQPKPKRSLLVAGGQSIGLLGPTAGDN